MSSTDPTTPTADATAPGTSHDSVSPAAAQDAPSSDHKKRSRKQELADMADKLAKTQQSLTEAEQKLAEAQDKYLRLLADFDNYRKRAQRDATDARHMGKLVTLEELLPVVDHFQMAMAHANEKADFAVLKQGMDMILAELERAFESLGVEKIPTAGQVFDPNQHEAVSAEPSDSVPENTVLRQWKTGYKIGERILRAAGVVVSSGPKAEPNQ